MREAPGGTTGLQAVVLAGGLGTRLGPETQHLPKPMVEVGGKPFLAHVIGQLASQGFDEVLLLVGYQAEVILGHFGDGSAFGTRIRYAREATPLGTGGALAAAAAQDLIAPRFLLLFGDLYREFDYAGMFSRHPGNCLAVYPYASGLTTVACGNVAFDPESGLVTAYVKDAPERALPYVDAGFGVFERSMMAGWGDRPGSFEQTLYPLLAARGGLAGERVDRNFHDIGNPADLAIARRAVWP